MAGRHYLPPPDNHRESRHPQPTYLSAADSRRIRHDEDRIASNNREIQALLHDNQRLAATHVSLKQELSVNHLDIRHLSAAAAKLKAEKDAEVREVYEKAMKMENEVRGVEVISNELQQVTADVQKLMDLKLELATKVKAVDADLVRAKAELQQLPAVEAEIETIRHHIQRGRAAIEYEKKVNASNLEQSRAMEKQTIVLAQEIEKLRAELANAEKRARAAAAAAVAPNPSPGYAAGYVNPGFVYGASPYPNQYPVPQVQGSVDIGSQYTYVAMAPPHGSYDVHQSHVRQQ